MVVTNTDGLILVYDRCGQEERLHGKMSIGIGGHVELLDDNVKDAADRELLEETGLQVPYQDQRYIGRIAQTGTLVERVHLGLLYQIYKPHTQELQPSGELLNPRWMPTDDLLEKSVHGKLESWSQQALTMMSAF
jgi:predicted NUDIX family phosphoesterase